MIRAFALCLVLSLAFSSGGTAAPERLILMLDWYKNPNHAPILLAQARGAYAQAGLDVTIQEPADPNDPPKLAAAGRVDVAIGYQPQTMILIDKGVPVVRIGALVPTPLNSVMVLANGSIKGLRDLKGRQTGYSVSGFEDALLGAMLERVHLKPTDVRLINVNFSLAPSLLSGQVDAVIGAFRNYESHQIVLNGQAVRTFPVEAWGVPPYEELIFLAGRDRAASRKFSAFIAATGQASRSIAQDPKRAWADLIAADPKFNNELNRRAFADTTKLFAVQPTRLDDKSYWAFARFMHERGLTKTVVSKALYAH